MNIILMLFFASSAQAVLINGSQINSATKITIASEAVTGNYGLVVTKGVRASSGTFTQTGTDYSVKTSSGIDVQAGTVKLETGAQLCFNTDCQSSVGLTGTGTAGLFPYRSAAGVLGDSPMVRDSAASLTVVGASTTISGPLLIKGGVFGDTSNSTWTYINSDVGTTNNYWTSVTGTTVTLTSHGGHICAFFACTLAAQSGTSRAYGSFLFNSSFIDGMTANQGFVGVYGSGGPAVQISSPWMHCSQGTYADGTSVSVVAVILSPDGSTVDVDNNNIQICQMFAWELR